MHDLSPGQEVTVIGPSGGPAAVVYVRGDSVRVRLTSGRERTVPLKRVTPKRESKALSVGPLSAAQLSAETMAKLDVLADESIEYSRRARPAPKPVTLRSEPYLAYVRKHPCCLCGASPSEAHHWSHHGGVMGSKVDDYRTVPLCQEHHRYWHDHGTLPGSDRVVSEGRFLLTQRALLTAWTDDHTKAPDMVDALIRAIGGQS